MAPPLRSAWRTRQMSRVALRRAQEARKTTSTETRRLAEAGTTILGDCSSQKGVGKVGKSPGFGRAED